MVLAARPAAAQQHADDAPDPDESPGDCGEISHEASGSRLSRPDSPPSDEVTAAHHADDHALLDHRQQPQPALGDQVAGGADGGVDVDGDRRVVITSPTVRRGPCV